MIFGVELAFHVGLLRLWQESGNAIPSHVLLLFDGPVLVVFIKAVLVQFDLLIDFKVIDNHALAAQAHQPGEWGSEEQIEEVYEEEDQKCTSWSTFECAVRS